MRQGLSVWGTGHAYVAVFCTGFVVGVLLTGMLLAPSLPPETLNMQSKQYKHPIQHKMLKQYRLKTKYKLKSLNSQQNLNGFDAEYLVPVKNR